MKRMRTLVAVLLASSLLATGCSLAGGEDPRTYSARFTRAVQVFPGVKVKVLGVDVGRITRVENVDGAVQIDFKIEDPDVRIPDDVKATLVPISLLGERYIQLFPAYEGGAELAENSTIPLERTAVPAEGDELLQSMQDYMGALDSDTVEEFVTNTADVIEGKGERLNDLIGSGTEVLAALDAKRDEISDLIVNFNTLTQSLATRQDALGQLINTYNVVGRTIDDVRTSLEGTITGLADAAAELASLLTDHRGTIDADIDSLTKTTRTLDRNVETFARTGHWAQRLFRAAGRAIDWDRQWLRLGNQGGPLVELIVFRLEDRIKGLCLRLGLSQCSTTKYWENRLPELFCLGQDECGTNNPSPERTIEEAIEQLPDEIENAIDNAKNKDCKEAKRPKRCRKKKKAIKDAQESGNLDDLDDVLNDIINGLGGTGEGKL